MQIQSWFKIRLIQINRLCLNKTSNKKIKNCLMKKLTIYQFAFALLAGIMLSSCYKLQKDYQYNPATLDPHINITAMRFMDSRGIAGVGADTVFKLMELGI